MVKIGSVTVPVGGWLAPMAGVTDVVFRELCSASGAALTCTEMVSAKGLLYSPDHGRELWERGNLSGPAAMQLFGREPEIMADMAEKYTGAYQLVDINMGCPAPKIVKVGQGSALMRETALAEEIVRQLVRRIPQPVTVKMRLGWDKDSINYLDFARRMEDAGASAIILHGRTREQFYAPAADWDAIGKAVAAVSVPVIGNGDVNCGADALRMLRETGCAAVMVGRAAQGYPWIFDEIRTLLSGEQWTPPTVQQRLTSAADHARRICEKWTERFGVPYLRKHMAWYLKGISGVALYRREIMAAVSLDELLDILQRVENANIL